MHLRRTLSATIVLVALCGWANPVAALSLFEADTEAERDTLEEISHSDRFFRLRSTLEAAVHANDTDAASLALSAFADAQVLADVHGAVQSQRFRSLYIQAHALYEEYHSPVAPIAITKEEMADLRGGLLAMLDKGLVQAILDESQSSAEPESEPVNWILYAPPHAESLVQRQIRRLRRQNALRGLQRRGRRYFPAINRALGRRGVPAEMRYITAIESSLDPGAISEAGALGLWQFLPTTGEMYGLSEADLHSVGRSTSAAARHLQRLGRMFNGDWQIVLAAYNCGSGCAQNAVRRARRRLGRTPTYWDIHRYLPAKRKIMFRNLSRWHG